MKKSLRCEIKQTEIQMLKLKKSILITEQLAIARQLEQNKRELKHIIAQIKQATNPSLFTPKE